MRVFFKTYGCQMNVRDTESVRALLERQGFAAAESETDADIIVVNTCSVRGKAEDKAIGKLGLLAAAKRERPGLLVGAMGCMVQRLGPGLFRKVPGLDFAAGTHRFAAIPSLIGRVLDGERHVLDVTDENLDVAALEGHVDGGVTAFVNILFGCDRRCAYCIVPAVRGREWSRPAVSIVEEVRRLADQGVREVTLLGQSVMSYGRRNPVWDDAVASPGGYREPLTRLLEAVNAVDGIARVRFTSGHPSGCTPELAKAMAALPSVCEHLHLPVQSGSDRILAAMRRGYAADDYRAAVACLRDAMPGIGITTDIIVGFPGETEADFEATRTLMQEIRFDNAFIFKYSPRDGTPAADFEDDVPVEEKERRNQVLLSDQERRGADINRALVGQSLEVLAEGPSLRNAARWSGRSRTNKIVIFDPPDGIGAGMLVTVHVDRAMPQTVYGQVMQES